MQINARFKQKHWNTETTMGYSDSSCDKEQDGTHFLLIGLSTAKLGPLLKPCKFYYKTHFLH